MPHKKILIFGIGNPGRGDDGLGPALIDRLKNSQTGDFQTHAEFGNLACACEFRYQLNVEDAYAVKDLDIVIFADAATRQEEAAVLEEAFPSDAIAFTTHRMSPASVLALCHELFGRTPKAYTLSIRGHHWDIGEGLSPQGAENLEQALEMLKEFLGRQRA